METPITGKSGIKRRGFASMTPERRREVTSMGGKQAHKLGTAHKFTTGSDLAREAGRKGGSSGKRAKGEVTE